MTLTDFKESFASSPECRENFFGEDSAKEYLHAKRTISLSLCLSAFSLNIISQYAYFFTNEYHG